MQDVISENKKFCKRNGMRHVLPDGPENWKYNKNTLDQLLNLIGLIHEKSSDYHAVTGSSLFQFFVINYFRKYYGMGWKSMSDCSKNV